MTTLRRRMTEDMQVRSLSPQTQATYVQQVSLFARHFNRSPELLGPESASATTASWPTDTENRNWRGAESCWACRHPNHRLRKPARTIPSAMNNSPVLRCGNAQSVTKVACT